MKFSDKREEFSNTVETLCLFMSLGAVFFQIWVLFSALESSFNGNTSTLFPGVVLSALGLAAAGTSALLTNMDFLKGIAEGRSKTYSKGNNRIRSR